MNTPKISVIVPVYNVEQYLPRCIDSILAQTFTDFELLLIDDGSPDNSGKICDEYTERDSRIRVFHKKNGGVSSARNVGLDNAQGEWIAFVDADDWIEDNMLKEMYAHAIRKNVNIVVAPFYINECHGQRIDNQKEEYVPQKFLKAILEGKAMGSLWNKLIHRNLYNNVKFDTDITYCEDILALTQIFCNSNVNISFVQIPFYHYFINAESITHTVKRYSSEIRFSFLEKLEILLKEQSCDFIGIVTIRRMRVLIGMVKSLLYTNSELNATYQTINNTISELGEYKCDYMVLRCEFLFWKLCCSYPPLFKMLKQVKVKIHYKRYFIFLQCVIFLFSKNDLISFYYSFL